MDNENVNFILNVFEKDAREGLRAAFVSLEIIRHVFLESFAVDTYAYHRALYKYGQLLIQIEFEHMVPACKYVVFRNVIRAGTLFFRQMRQFRLRSHRLGGQVNAYFKDHIKQQVRRNWTVLKVAAKFLSLHKRAVVTANHPDRKRKRNEFECGPLDVPSSA